MASATASSHATGGGFDFAGVVSGTGTSPCRRGSAPTLQVAEFPYQKQDLVRGRRAVVAGPSPKVGDTKVKRFFCYFFRSPTVPDPHSEKVLIRNRFVVRSVRIRARSLLSDRIDS
jgi:hypothetical protein